jgi:hypothetical protein
MTTDTDKKTPAAPPYISFKTLTNLLERLKEKHIPPRIDRSYLSGMSNGYQSQVIAALRWLDLIGDNGEVTPLLGDLATDEARRPELIGDLLRDRYGRIVALGDQNATQGQLEEAFREFGVSGSTLRKAIAFYLNAAQFAEMRVSPHFKTPPVRSADGKPATRKPKATAGRDPKAEEGGEVPEAGAKPTNLQSRYVEMLLKKVETQEQMDDALLDRIEKLLGYGTENQE